MNNEDKIKEIEKILNILLGADWMPREEFEKAFEKQTISELKELLWDNLDIIHAICKVIKQEDKE